MKSLLIILITSFVFSVIESKWDSNKAKKNKKIMHKLSLFFRFLIGVPFCFIVSCLTFNFSIDIIVGTFLYLGLAAVQWWITFDISFNLWHGNKWNYIGTTSAIDKNSTKETLIIKFSLYGLGWLFNYLFIIV